MLNAKKILLSIYALYHIFAIVVFPNPYSYLREHYSKILLPYLNAFGLNSTWSFYAPDPEISRYLEYEVDTKYSKEGKSEPITYRWAPEPRHWLNFSRNRLHTSMAFFSSNRDWIEQLFIPFACRLHPEADFITVRHVYVRVPTLEEVQNGAPIFDPDMTMTDRLGAKSCH